VHIINPEAFGEPFTEPDIAINVYADGGGLPGTLIYADTVENADVIFDPGWTQVVIPDGGLQIVGDFWVGVGNVSADPETDYIYHGWNMEDAINGGSFYYSYSDPPRWKNLSYEGNWRHIVEFCAIPVEERACWVEDDFPMLGHDMYHTGASGIPIGDAWCDLNLTHHWNVLGTFVSLSAPIIFDNRAICAFFNQYKVYDLITGDELATFTGTPEVGEYISATPMVITVDILGTPTDLLLCPSGTTREVTAYDLSTYTLAWMSERLDANITWGNLIYLNGIIYASTDDADVYAINATDGTLYTGWGDNPINLGLNIYVAGGTDGENIYIGTVDGATSPTMPGDLYKLNALDGTTIWEFSGEGGFQGIDLYVDTLEEMLEGFYSGITYDPELEVLYANSECDHADHPADGVFYIINTDGSLVSSAISQRSLYNTPIIDQTRVYIVGFSRWVDPPLGGNILAFRRQQGDFNFAIPTGPGEPFFSQGILTCETEAPDLLFAHDYAGFMYCFDMDNQKELFRRRVDNGAGSDVGCGMAMGRDADENVHILATGRNGDLYDFTKGDDRPRLQLNSYKVKVPVEPGTDPAATYYIDSIITNTGCAPLNIYSCVISTEDTGSVIPDFSIKNIRPDIFNRAASIADMLTTSKLPSTYDLNSTEVSFDVLNVPAEKGYNQASAATYLEDLIQGVYCPARAFIVLLLSIRPRRLRLN